MCFLLYSCGILCTWRATMMEVFDLALIGNTHGFHRYESWDAWVTPVTYHQGLTWIDYCTSILPQDFRIFYFWRCITLIINFRKQTNKPETKACFLLLHPGRHRQTCTGLCMWLSFEGIFQALQNPASAGCRQSVCTVFSAETITILERSSVCRQVLFGSWLRTKKKFFLNDCQDLIVGGFCKAIWIFNFSRRLVKT